MLDLRTGEVRPFERLDYVTKTIAVPYIKDAKCPVFDKFMEDVMCGDIEKMDYVQAVFGYSLTGSMQENKVPFFIGEGGSGVSTITKLIKSVIGKDFAVTSPNDLICYLRVQSKSSNLDYERARLKGVRLAMFIELSSSMQFNSDFLKLTGGDDQNARRAYADAGEFTPTNMSLCTGNGMPMHPKEMSVNNYPRRIRIVRFLCIFHDDPAAFKRQNPYFKGIVKQIDSSILSKMEEEKEGILAWMVRGALKWYENNMSLDRLCPASVRKDTDDYLVQKDDLSNFVDDMCVLGPNKRDADGNAMFDEKGKLVSNCVKGTELLEAFNKYRIEEAGKTDKMDAEKFKTALLNRYKTKGVEKPEHVYVDGKKVRGYKGISLKEGISLEIKY
jgi:putative DNA primase/helicase